MENIKKLISVFLVLALISCVPTFANANETKAYNPEELIPAGLSLNMDYAAVCAALGDPDNSSEDEETFTISYSNANKNELFPSALIDIDETITTGVMPILSLTFQKTSNRLIKTLKKRLHSCLEVEKQNLN